MGLSEFHDTLATIILYFGGDIGDGHCRSEISLIRRRGHPFSYLYFFQCRGEGGTSSSLTVTSPPATSQEKGNFIAMTLW